MSLLEAREQGSSRRVFILEEQDSIIMEYLQSLGMDENEKTVILTGNSKMAKMSVE